MRIKIVSIPVLDQQKALDFYTDILGFIKKADVPLGGGNRWLTVVSKYDQDGPELLLEPAPLHFPPSKLFQEELMSAGMPWTQFYVDSVQEEYDRLTKFGVEFSMGPTDAGTVVVAVFNDTCGNNIQLIEEK
jgi:catechol 2,3-dioxygenase-like lactoylglutathione lyase family enzyme